MQVGSSILKLQCCMQEMLAPELSFVLHTADPMTGTNGEVDRGSVFAEVAPGLGETLASGTQGSAWRMSISKASGDIKLYSYANFSEAYMPVGRTGPRAQPGQSIYGSVDSEKVLQVGMVAKQTMDYSQQELSKSEKARDVLGKMLVKVGVAAEDAFGGPQDVEGAVVGGQVYVVQSRPQPK
jgi:phosphoglucan, water dikinase